MKNENEKWHDLPGWYGRLSEVRYRWLGLTYEDGMTYEDETGDFADEDADYAEYGLIIRARTGDGQRFEAAGGVDGQYFEAAVLVDQTGEPIRSAYAYGLQGIDSYATVCSNLRANACLAGMLKQDIEEAAQAITKRMIGTE